jgi:hypothetical protein
MSKFRLAVAALAIGVALCTVADPSMAAGTAGGADSGWINLFDGKTLNGWIPKVLGYPAGQDPLETFRVKDGTIVINYDKYGGDIKGRWAHLFFKQPFHAYRLSLEYRFFGEEMQPLRRTQWNSGVIYHTQSPQSMGLFQPYPIGVEGQILGYFDVKYRDGEQRMTASACGLGTTLSRDGVVTDDCFKSSVPTPPNDRWTKFEVEVLPDGRVREYINGVMNTWFDHALYDTDDDRFPSQNFIDAQGGNRLITSGYICLQSEGHPVAFRNIRIKLLSTDPAPFMQGAQP